MPARSGDTLKFSLPGSMTYLCVFTEGNYFLAPCRARWMISCVRVSLGEKVRRAASLPLTHPEILCPLCAFGDEESACSSGEERKEPEGQRTSPGNGKESVENRGQRQRQEPPGSPSLLTKLSNKGLFWLPHLLTTPSTPPPVHTWVRISTPADPAPKRPLQAGCFLLIGARFDTGAPPCVLSFAVIPHGGAAPTGHADPHTSLCLPAVTLEVRPSPSLSFHVCERAVIIVLSLLPRLASVFCWMGVWVCVRVCVHTR